MLLCALQEKNGSISKRIDFNATLGVVRSKSDRNDTVQSDGGGIITVVVLSEPPTVPAPQVVLRDPDLHDRPRRGQAIRPGGCFR